MLTLLPSAKSAEKICWVLKIDILFMFVCTFLEIAVYHPVTQCFFPLSTESHRWETGRNPVCHIVRNLQLCYMQQWLLLWKPAVDVFLAVLSIAAEISGMITVEGRGSIGVTGSVRDNIISAYRIWRIYLHWWPEYGQKSKFDMLTSWILAKV